ncbi:hypothetical protein BDR05DRAFT_1004713, partial [Suillus weaverae]
RAKHQPPPGASPVSTRASASPRASASSAPPPKAKPSRRRSVGASAPVRSPVTPSKVSAASKCDRNEAMLMSPDNKKKAKRSAIRSKHR